MDTSELYGGDPPATWAKARTYGIGGSEAPAVLGLNPWCSPYTLWCRKTGLIEGIEQTERMRWGHRLEDAIAEYYAEETGLKVFAVATTYNRPRAASVERYDDGMLFRNTERPWQLASVDRLVECPGRGLGVLEIKNVGVRSADKWKDGVPDYVRAQNLHYQSVLGLDWGAVAVLFGGNSPGFMDVEAAEGEVERLVAAEQAFWLSLDAGEPPEADGSESTRDTLAERFPKPEDGHVARLSDDAIAWDRAYAEHAEQEKYHKKKKRAFETLIRAEMGAAERATLASGVTWKSTTVEPVFLPEHTRKGYRKYTRSAPKAKR